MATPRSLLRGFRPVPVESTDDNVVLLSQAILQLQERARMAPLEVVSATATFSMADQDLLVLANATSAGFSVTLPPAAGREGKRVAVKKIDSTANLVLIRSNDGTETIDGTLTVTLATQYNCRELVSDLTNWHVVGSV